ncbi:transcriptional regulator [Thermaurantimonas aggregans]|uniref:Transcriptional regulator n=1 Tax=Thermaurantimonas aggregans TaxID=2173829 RepID=A0A401XMB2_9FLAO|nr:helix-turn-helix transcriptional regulator [Thermaurantimonas aggregans]MCX8147999.1 helix-turn-helix transcriptional regulator [Thermaurantimonas aggregans]GCD78128.1 transcriptional regulator [Thermaurantimonas aggregans]
MKNRLRVERAEIKLSQAELAQKVGVSRQTINAIERGDYNPSVALALKIAQVFGKHVEQIFQLEDSDWQR